MKVLRLKAHYKSRSRAFMQYGSIKVLDLGFWNSNIARSEGYSSQCVLYATTKPRNGSRIDLMAFQRGLKHRNRKRVELYLTIL